jgi:hypothetical protein
LNYTRICWILWGLSIHDKHLAGAAILHVGNKLNNIR